ncbi:MAG: diguanylate cyclase [Coriobacteriales bacterium]|nr:diguanylate cyclase [Coriobacteriales bacterium]
MSRSGADARPLDSAPQPPADFLIQHVSPSCTECWGCVRVCPARALRVVEGRSEVIEERCVKCGACVGVCGHSSHTVRDDTAAVRALLRTGRPVVALLASEASAAMYPHSLDEIESMLETLGFTAVETTVLGEEIIAEAYERIHGRIGDALPRLRSTCPVTVDWVRRFYPQLTGALVPLVPPYVAQARLIRRVYPADVAVVYVSPCYARKDEVFESEVAGAVDVAIDFSELGRLLAVAPRRPRPDGRSARRPRAVKQLSLTDGFPRRILAEAGTASTSVVTVRGLEAIDELLTAIVRGEAAPPVVDMLLCDGCIDGPAVAPDLSVYAKRGIAMAERERQGPALVDSREFLAALPQVEVQRSFAATPALRQVPSAEEVADCLAQAGFCSADETIDCGACGYTTCVEHAQAVLLGNSTWDMCFPLQRRKAKFLADELDRLAARDALTGLYNRRAFDERLAEETAHAHRYETALSLIMFDVDRFKDVNDRFGHPAGDAVLSAVADVLQRELRASDVACRYGGDEFAVILPGSTKTEAFAVAEKLREALYSGPIVLPEGQSVRVTASLGVAAVGALIVDGPSLLAAADRALYGAKAAGRNRAHLAAG